ncbi:unnamed protein product [Phytophthora fragariaefolia]|uniref:Unnamed protein product n=1 Tax=Phytophthora fragariaefolia TaxID=1490495 RepID=A0A9W6UBT1_9STRA|nr:unnamed protein product [Phytophthora fragariaefolia]
MEGYLNNAFDVHDELGLRELLLHLILHRRNDQQLGLGLARQFEEPQTSRGGTLDKRRLGLELDDIAESNGLVDVTHRRRELGEGEDLGFWRWQKLESLEVSEGFLSSQAVGELQHYCWPGSSLLSIVGQLPSLLHSWQRRLTLATARIASVLLRLEHQARASPSLSMTPIFLG